MGARLGQHFLKNKKYARMLAQSCNLQEGDVAVEVGPGTGVLTRELVDVGAHVIAIEKDEKLAREITPEFGDSVRLITGDVRDFVPNREGLLSGQYSVVANIPYYITGEIIRQFLTDDVQPKCMALLIQKEVAQRIVSQTESILSLSVKVFGNPKIIAKVSAGNFSPPPKVDSAILLIDDISRNNLPTKTDEQNFFHVVRAGFASKRKTIFNNLSKEFGREQAMMALNNLKIDMNERAEKINLQTWLCFAKELRKSIVPADLDTS